MALHAPSISTWSAAPLNPDGEYGALSPWRLLVGLVSSAMGGAGLLLLLLHPAYGWGVSLLAAAILLAAARAACFARKGLLGAHGLLRVLVLLGVGSAYGLQRPEDSRVVWSTVSILLLAVLGESLLRRVLGGRTFVAAHLVGMPDIPTVRLPGWSIPVTSALVAGAGLLVGVSAVSAWIWLALGVVGLSAPALVGMNAIRRGRRGGRARPPPPAAVRKHAPEFAVYAGRP